MAPKGLTRDYGSMSRQSKYAALKHASVYSVSHLLRQGALLDDVKHPNSDKDPDQRMFVININDYVCLVPYVENTKEIFLKTVIPSRKTTKAYLGESE